jgi:hypothetical protein
VLGDEFPGDPKTKAFKVRKKFLSKQFFKSEVEDKTSVQNLERRLDQVIFTQRELFSNYEINDEQQQQLLIKLFKRFFYRTIERKYGYLKPNAPDQVELSGTLLCEELELNPKVLLACGVLSSFADEVKVNWFVYLKVISLFLLKHDVLKLRFEFLVSFLNIKDKKSMCLDDKRHMEQKLRNFRFSKRHEIEIPSVVQACWERIRMALKARQSFIFEILDDQRVEQRLVECLLQSGITAADI